MYKIIMPSVSNPELFEYAIQRVRAQSAPVHTIPVGWSEKTQQLLDILKQNNPYTTLPDKVVNNLNSLRQMPEPRTYLPWVVVGPGFKEIYAAGLNPPLSRETVKDYAKY